MKFVFRNKEYFFHSHLLDTYIGGLWRWESRKRDDGIAVINVSKKRKEDNEFSLSSLSEEEFFALNQYLNYGIVSFEYVEAILHFVSSTGFYDIKTFDYPDEFLAIKLHEDWYRKFKYYKNLDKEVAERFNMSNYLIALNKDDVHKFQYACKVREYASHKYVPSTDPEVSMNHMRKLLCVKQINEISGILEKQEKVNLEEKGIDTSKLISISKEIKEPKEVSNMSSKMFEILGISNEQERCNEFISHMLEKQLYTFRSMEFGDKINFLQSKAFLLRDLSARDTYIKILNELKETKHLQIIIQIYKIFCKLMRPNFNVASEFDFVKTAKVKEFFEDNIIGGFASFSKDEDELLDISRDDVEFVVDFFKAIDFCNFLFDGTCIFAGPELAKYFQSCEISNIQLVFVNTTEEKAKAKIKRIFSCFKRNYIVRKNDKIYDNQSFFSFSFLIYPDVLTAFMRSGIGFDGKEIYIRKRNYYSLCNQIIFLDFDLVDHDYYTNICCTSTNSSCFIYIPEYRYDLASLVNIVEEKDKNVIKDIIDPSFHAVELLFEKAYDIKNSLSLKKAFCPFILNKLQREDILEKSERVNEIKRIIDRIGTAEKEIGMTKEEFSRAMEEARKIPIEIDNHNNYNYIYDTLTKENNNISLIMKWSLTKQVPFNLSSKFKGKKGIDVYVLDEGSYTVDNIPSQLIDLQRFMDMSKDSIEHDKLFVRIIISFDIDHLLDINKHYFAKISKIDKTIDKSIQFKTEFNFDKDELAISSENFDSWYCGLREQKMES